MPGDTDDRAQAAQVSSLRRLGASRRIALAAEMSEAARQISIEGERRRHPDLTYAQARLAVLRRIWGAALTAHMDTAAQMDSAAHRPR